MRDGGVRKPRGGYGRALGAPHGDGGYTWAGIVRTSAVPGAGCWEDVMIVEVVPPSPPAGAASVSVWVSAWSDGGTL